MRPRLRALAALLPGLVACNDYQFRPVGSCVLQPGSVRVELPKISSADILFVIDDSPSMDPKQAQLAARFQSFIQQMVNINAGRAARGLEPLDFQIGVTTSSIFTATPDAPYCVGGSSCCAATSCTVATCTRGTNAGCGAGQTCVHDDLWDATTSYIAGEQTRCCTVSSCTSAAPCSAGDRCPIVQRSFPASFPGNCTPGLAVAGAPYAAGKLVSAGANPKVLAFPKTLSWSSWTTAAPDPNLTALVRQFQQNVLVGSCGAGEEQHLESGLQALSLAVSGAQPGVAAGSFPRADAKLVVVFLGDEDDCSSATTAPLVMTGFTPGADSCVLDKHRATGDQREYPVSRYADALRQLRSSGRVADLAAAFIVSSVRCADGSYAPADVCFGPATCPVQPPGSCAPPAPVCGGAYAAGERFLALADLLRGDGVPVVEGSVCDDFGPILAGIADLAKPPSMLELPSTPGARAVTNVRIVDANGADVKTCQPGSDWCFVDCAAQNGACLSSGTSRCIAINHTNGQCEANPGETYAADYLGQIPAGGCATAAECATALGGGASKWSCLREAGMARGTCACSGQ